MMNDFILATQFRIFIFEDIKTMGTSRYDFRHLVLIQCLDILVSHHLENKFIAGTPDRIAGA